MNRLASLTSPGTKCAWPLGLANAQLLPVNMHSATWTSITWTSRVGLGTQLGLGLGLGVSSLTAL